MIRSTWRRNDCINIVAGTNHFRTNPHQQRNASYNITEIMGVSKIILLPTFVILLVPVCLSVPLWDRASLVCAAIAGKQWVLDENKFLINCWNLKDLNNKKKNAIKLTMKALQHLYYFSIISKHAEIKLFWESCKF